MGAESESISMQVISSISTIASFTIILIYYRFPHLRKKSSYTLQYYVALSSLLTSIGSAIGVVQTGTISCWFQGLLTNIFTLSSIQWTTVMTFSLFSIVHYEKQLEVTPLIHLYCWLPPILVSVIPLIDSTYGNVGNWCWIIDTKKTPKWGGMFWFWVSFYGWVWFSMIIMIIILATINYKSLNQDSTSTMKSLRKIIYTLNLFPLIIFISWGPACVSDTILQIFGSYNDTFGLISSQLACLQGLLTAILFWTRNRGARRLVPVFFQFNAKIHDEDGKGPNRHHNIHNRRQSFESYNSSIEGSSVISSSNWSSLSDQVSRQINSIQSRIRVEITSSRRGSSEYQSTPSSYTPVQSSRQGLKSSFALSSFEHTTPTSLNNSNTNMNNSGHGINISNHSNHSYHSNQNTNNNNNSLINEFRTGPNLSEDNANTVREFHENKLKYDLLHLFQESMEAV